MVVVDVGAVSPESLQLPMIVHHDAPLQLDLPTHSLLRDFDTRQFCLVSAANHIYTTLKLLIIYAAN